MRIKKFYQYIKEELPFDSYPGAPLIAKPADYVNALYPSEDELDNKDRDAIHGYGFSFPYYKNGPFITRWNGDNVNKLGIKGGQNGGRISGEYDSQFKPGGEIKKNLSKDNVPEYVNRGDKKSERRKRILNYLQQLNKK